MPPLPCYNARPCVLLTNDDGPPASSSPNIFSFAKLLQQRLGWDVKVVIPDCQKSWVGKAYAISDVISLSYFYPQEPDGLNGDVTTTPRPLKTGESMEWILLSGTPASCANIALHNLYPGQIDLVVSGPNHGRNSSTAFALSSGTLGAALAATLSVPLPGPSSGPSLHTDHIPCIAVSYGVVTRPVSPRALELANDVSVDVCARLWEDWGYEDDTGRKVQIYSINVPLVVEPLEKDRRKVCWTDMWRNAYGQLFKTTKLDPSLNWWQSQAPSRPNQPSLAQTFPSLLTQSLSEMIQKESKSKSDPVSRVKAAYDPGDNTAQSQSGQAQTAPTTSNRPDKPIPPAISTTATAGPGALPTPAPESPAEGETSSQIRFHFAPTMGPLLNPPEGSVPEGTDAWAFANGYVSVTPIRAEYAGLHHHGRPFGGDQPTNAWAGRIWD